VGTVLGALPWYYAGKLLGEALAAAMEGKWLGLSARILARRGDGLKHGNKAVFFCRLVPECAP